MEHVITKFGEISTVDGNHCRIAIVSSNVNVIGSYGIKSCYVSALANNNFDHRCLTIIIVALAVALVAHYKTVMQITRGSAGPINCLSRLRRVLYKSHSRHIPFISP